MAKNLPPQDPEDARTDLLAAMAASRELGPEMDKALVDSYMEKHGAPARSAAQPAAPAVRASSPEFLSFMGMGLGIVAYIVLLIVTHGALWWMFWPLMAWGGWRWGSGSWGGNRGESGSARDEYRRARWEYRMQRRAARFGLPYPSDYNQPPALPPQQPQYPQYPQPQYPQPQYPQPQYPQPQYSQPQYSQPQYPSARPAPGEPVGDSAPAQPPRHEND